MEVSMHGSFDKSGETVKSIYRRWGIGIFALPVLIVIALVGLAATHKTASDRMSEAARAEFIRTGSPQIAPTQLERPNEIRTVKAN
jgi:hypothetical protein